MSIDRAHAHLDMAASHHEAARRNLAEARRRFQRVLDNPKATAGQKYEAAVLLDEVTESEVRFAEVDRKLAEFKRKIGDGGGAPQTGSKEPGTKRKS